MATTAKGTPYVVSTDLVANYPTVSSDLADHIDDNLAYNAVTINAQTGTTYTFALADASEGKLVTASNAASQTYTVPPQSSVTWAAGAVLRILNQGAGTVTIAAGSGVTINGTPLTLAQYKGAAIQRTASNTWTFIPFSGGVGNAVISDTPTGSYTGYQYWSFTASGTLTVTTAGFADVLVVGGGGGGGRGDANRAGSGGGAGGHLQVTNAYLPVGSQTIVVGAGGAGGSGNNYGGYSGATSRMGSLYSTGGGAGLTFNPGTTGGPGGSGGGGGGEYNSGTYAGGAGTSGIGNDGGTGFGNSSAGAAGGGGGGAGAVGGNASNAVGGNGGAGLANDYTGTSVTRAGGGGGGNLSAAGTPGSGGTGGGGAGSENGATATSGTVNTGGGGGGGGGTGNGGAGGSGVVIIRVAV